ncbi:MAG TPA: glycosyltransferase family 39 protein [Acidobacteriota bacterium]|mgnify:CR=1 FL=1|nr:glycosyltransferase family 39 protein [Acidobacteriota bacterium]
MRSADGRIRPSENGIHVVKKYLFLAILALPFFVVLDESALWDANEAFYVQTPREMLERGDWLVPYFNGQPRLNKPPLSYWLVGVFYSLFGVSLFWERLVLAALGFGSVLLTYRAGTLLFDSRTALLAAGIAATSFRLLMLSRRLLIDVLLLFCLLAVLLFFLKWLKHGRSGGLYGAAVFLGLAFLAKGPVALLAPFFLGLFLLYYRKKVSLRLSQLALPGLLFVIIASSWFVLLVMNRGWEPVIAFFLEENLGRFSHVDFGPSRGIFYYAGVFLGDFFPWSLFFVVALAAWGIRAVRYARLSDKDDTSHPVRAEVLLLIWVFGFLAVFSLSHNKQEYYILPVYPVASLWLAGQLRHRITPRWLLLGLAVLTPAVMVALYLFASRILDPGLVPLWLPLLAAPFVVYWLVRQRLDLSAASLAVFYALAFISYLPPFEEYKPIPAFAQKIRELSRVQGRPVEAGYFNLAAPSLVFYTGSPVFEAYSLAEATSRFGSGKLVLMIVRAEDYDALCAASGRPLQIVDSRPKIYTTARFLLKGLTRDGYHNDPTARFVYLISSDSLDETTVIHSDPGLQ